MNYKVYRKHVNASVEDNRLEPYYSVNPLQALTVHTEIVCRYLSKALHDFDITRQDFFKVMDELKLLTVDSLAKLNGDECVEVMIGMYQYRIRAIAPVARVARARSHNA